MQQSTYYQLSEPEYGENSDIALINGNMDVIDTALAKARSRNTDVYSELTSYAVGDFCIYNDMLYKCTGATSGAWDSTKWTQTSIAAAFEPKHTWTLLETITADGTLKRYTKALPSNANGILIVCYFKATENAGTHFRALLSSDGTNFTAIAYIGSAVTNADRYGRCEIIKDGNLWKGEATQAGTAIGSAVSLIVLNNGYAFNLNATHLRIETTGSINFESGSTFEIYIRQ